MANPIVNVLVSQTQAPIPSDLQRKGALISQGGTTLAVGDVVYLTQLDDLTTILKTPLGITNAVWASSFGGQVTITTTAAHGVPINSEFITTLAGILPVGYNGTVRAMATGTSTFTYYLVANPGAFVSAGTYTPAGVGELQSMATSFFTQGGQLSVGVQELGNVGNVTAAVAVLAERINVTDAQMFYSYLVPRSWDGNAAFLAFAATKNSTTAKTYFYVTTNLQNRGLYNDTMKSVELFIESPPKGTWAANAITEATYSTSLVTLTTTTAHGVAPGQFVTIAGFTPAGYNGTFMALPGTTGSTLIYAVTADPGADTIQGTLVASLYTSYNPPASQFDHASDFWRSLSYDPSTTNKVAPFSFGYLYGVTQFPILGNASLISSLKDTNVNYVGTGAEGGITNTMLLWGKLQDGRVLNYWYAADYMQIIGAQRIANAIINGSNNPINPLYYNQPGIDRLQQVLASAGASAITVGLALGRIIQTQLDGPAFAAELDKGTYAGNVVVNAVPFRPYAVANPSHYRLGKYDGLSLTFTPQIGFLSITVNINITDFVAGTGV
jgi:hypothetical protein